jgi:hypothetical protein
MRPTVEAKVDVLAIEAVSTSFAGLTALIFGEAGWNHEGGFSLGYSFRGQFTIARVRDLLRTYDLQGLEEIR